MRAFVAVRPPEEAAEDLDAFLDVRRGAPRAEGLRWAPVDQLHVTLAFLPAVPDRVLDDLVERLAVAAGRRASFEARLAGGGAFPHVTGGRVLWCGVDLDLGLDPVGRTELDRLAVGSRAAATRAGCEVDGARFRPHVTVARTRRPLELTPWVRLLDGYAGPPWMVGEIELVESRLGQGPRGRPEHVTTATFPLLGGGSR